MIFTPGAIGASPVVRPFFNRGASGPSAPTFVTDSIMAFENPIRIAPTTNSPPPVTIAAGDVIVVCVTQRNSGSGAPTSVTVDGGGAPVTTLAVSAVGFPATTVDAFLYFITGAAAGSRVVFVLMSGNNVTTATGGSVGLIVLRGCAAAPFDKSASTTGASSVGPFTVGPTPALTVANQFDIAMIGIGNSGQDPTPWVAPFVHRIGTDVFDPTGDADLWIADRTSLTTAAVSATTNGITDFSDFAMCLATFKGA